MQHFIVTFWVGFKLNRGLWETVTVMELNDLHFGVKIHVRKFQQRQHTTKDCNHCGTISHLLF